MRRGQDIVHHKDVTLANLYNGFVQKFAFQKKIICVECHGKGEIIAIKDRCKTCKGEKTVLQESNKRTILKVNIKKGMYDGQKIVCKGAGHQEPELQPGDFIVILRELKHDVFKRVDQDLMMTMQLQLVESLCGFQKVIKTLDNRNLVVTNLPGEVVKHNSFKCILGEGMPLFKNQSEKGRLVIQFLVEFPEQIPPLNIITELKNYLLPRPRVDISIDAEECNTVSFLIATLEKMNCFNVM